MVSEDYLGLNDQLVLAVSYSKLQKSHLSFKYKRFVRILIVKYCSPILISLFSLGIYYCGIPNHGILAPWMDIGEWSIYCRRGAHTKSS